MLRVSSMRHSAILAMIAVAALALVRAQMPPQCYAPRPAREQILRANSSTVAWGYFWKHRQPQLYVQSGETFSIEMVSHHNGDMYDWIIKGDAALEDIYNFNSTSQTISMRGRSGRADGKHIMTGPVYICGAEPGDTLKIEILDLKPRRNPMTGKAFSSNGVTDWGWQRRIEGSRRTDSTFIYELIMDADGYAMYAEPRLSFTWKDAAGNPLVRVPCWPFNGTLTGMNNQTLNWSNPFQSLGIYTISGFNYTCVDGYVMLGGYHYAGAIVQHPLPTDDYSVNGKWRLPVSPHIGNIGLASDVEDTVNSAWPMRTAGNIDHKRLGMGSELYVPVEVAGGLLSAGDCHAGQTNSEYSGTALETNFNGRLRVTVIKANDPTISPLYKNLPTPLLENANEWCFHGYTVNDFLHDPQTATGRVGSWNSLLPPLAVNTYQLMNNTAVVTTNGLMKLGFTRDQASSIMTFACDWEVTQVVNTNMGNHMCCLKYIMPVVLDKGAYVPTTFPGSSRPLRISNNRISRSWR
ncbi:hypothetical protein V8C86DRAFT_1040010 [Haematococcus lacustris]